MIFSNAGIFKKVNLVVVNSYVRKIVLIPEDPSVITFGNFNQVVCILIRTTRGLVAVVLRLKLNDRQQYLH